MVAKIKQEIRILKQLRHPNVVELKEVLASRQQIFMIMELVPGGELFDKIIAEGPMSVSTAGHALLQTGQLTSCISDYSRQHACSLAADVPSHADHGIMHAVMLTSKIIVL